MGIRARAPQRSSPEGTFSWWSICRPSAGSRLPETAGKGRRDGAQVVQSEQVAGAGAWVGLWGVRAVVRVPEPLEPAGLGSDPTGRRCAQRAADRPHGRRPVGSPAVGTGAIHASQHLSEPVEIRLIPH